MLDGQRTSVKFVLIPMTTRFRVSKSKGRTSCRILLPSLLLAAFSGPLMASQAETEVSPDSTPEVRQIQPTGAQAGGEVSIKIDGRNFSRGAYVSFSAPTVHMVATRRISATQLEAQVAIASKAQPGQVSLYVSNPAGAVAEVPFAITAASTVPVTPTSEIQPSQLGTPEVTAVNPPGATGGSELTVMVTGKNFAPRAKVGFSNQGIRVLETKASGSSELAVRIRIARDAPTGQGSLFVVNPDEREAEAAFEVAQATPAAPPAPATVVPGKENPAAPASRFEVYNLGEAVSLLQDAGKAKGALTMVSGKLKYEQDGTEVFSATRRDIQEIDLNTYFGVKTPVFHIILNSGKTMNFVAVSLKTEDSQSIVNALRSALK